jgi:CheY-like chemotaxis protein
VQAARPLLGATLLEMDAPVPVAARIDPQQLEQVVVNLLMNARDAITAAGGEGRIHVRLAGDSTSVRLRVEDDGCGIPAENLDKLFEPFFTTKRSGAGLGLPVVQQILERHHGRITVEPQPVRGSAFVVTLPRAEDLQEAVPAAEVDLVGRHVLVIEDEPAVADGIVDLLDAAGLMVRVASSGAAALEMIEAELPEVAMLDVGLPDIDGVDLFAAIRERWPALPILFSTGHGDQARLDQLLRQPHVGHLVKPFGMHEMTVALASALAA